MESSAGLSRELRFEVDATALARAVDRAARRRRNAYFSLLVPAAAALTSCTELATGIVLGACVTILYVPGAVVAAVIAIRRAEADATALGMSAKAFVELVPRWPALLVRDTTPEPSYLQGRAP